MNDFSPTTGTEAQWDAAFDRLDSYLRALGMDEGERQSEVILEILRRAAARHELLPDLDPTRLAMEEMQIAMDAWFARIAGGEDRFSVGGRVALLISDATKRWPAALLAEDVAPEVYHAIRASKVQAGPNLRVSSMVPRPLDHDPHAGVRPATSGDSTPWILPLVIFCSVLGGIVILLSH